MSDDLAAEFLEHIRSRFKDDVASDPEWQELPRDQHIFIRKSTHENIVEIRWDIDDVPDDSLWARIDIKPVGGSSLTHSLRLEFEEDEPDNLDNKKRDRPHTIAFFIVLVVLNLCVGWLGS